MLHSVGKCGHSLWWWEDGYTAFVIFCLNTHSAFFSSAVSTYSKASSIPCLIFWSMELQSLFSYLWEFCFWIHFVYSAVLLKLSVSTGRWICPLCTAWELLILSWPSSDMLTGMSCATRIVITEEKLQPPHHCLPSSQLSQVFFFFFFYLSLCLL